MTGIQYLQQNILDRDIVFITNIYDSDAVFTAKYIRSRYSFNSRIYMIEIQVL